ncbi:hypothetical protein STAN_4018 [Streptomyces sp. CBMAI 2042]|nr:hypothetical protein STAN_4018 [Streptomyces sp. CBMAI 2042]
MGLDQVRSREGAEQYFRLLGR